MYNIFRAKQAFKQNRNKMHQESINKRQNSQSFYDQMQQFRLQYESNNSLSLTKSKTNNSITINTINRTINSLYIDPRRESMQIALELQKTVDTAEVVNKFQSSFKESSRHNRRINTSYKTNNKRPISYSKSVVYGNKEEENNQNQNIQVEHHGELKLENLTIIQQGLIQETLKPIINQNEQLDKIKEEVNSIQKNLESDSLENDEWIYQVDYKKLEFNVFSLDELKYLVQEFQKEEYERNYLTLDKILLKNKFFQRFGQGIRIGIMEKASIQIHNVGKVILQLGGNSNNLFVILRGSCQQTLTMDIQLEDYEYLTVQSYFDGQDLSEINLLQLNNNRGYSVNKYIDLVEGIKEHPKLKELIKNERTKLITSHISCAEQTYLLRMNNDQFQKILKQSIEKDKEFKLSILSQIRFFQYTSASQLLHLVAELGIQNYSQGDCVVRKGDELNRVIIIASGEFEIVEEIQFTRETRNYFLENKLKPLKQKKNIDRNTRPEIPRDIPDQSFDLSFTNNQQVIKNQKCYQYCNKQIKGKNLIEYTHLHILKTLKKCDVICGRSLLIQYDNEYNQEMVSKAKLTVVLKSVQGSVFFLDQKRFQNLPESLQNQIVSGLRQMKEFDDYEINSIRKEIKSWEKYKQKLYQQSIQEKRQQSFKAY